jgi:hypothetical protein
MESKYLRKKERELADIAKSKPKELTAAEKAELESRPKSKPVMEEVVVVKNMEEVRSLPKGTKYKFPNSDKILTQKYSLEQRRRRPPALPKTLPKMEKQKPPALPKSKPMETDIVRAELQKRIRKDQEEAEVESVIDEMLDIVETTETRPEGIFEEEAEEQKIDTKQEPSFNWSIGGPRSRRMLRTPDEEKYDIPESDRMDQNDVFSDNMIRGVNSYNAFLPNPLVPIRGRYSEFSIGSEVRDLNNNMRNDANPEVNPPQNILEQNRILEGDMNQMPANEPGNPLNNALDIAGNNLYSMDQRAFLNRRRGVRERHQSVVGADDEFFVEGEVEEEPVEGKYNDEDDVENEVSGLTNRERNEMQLRQMQLGQLRRDAPVGKEWDYLRSAMKKGDSFNLANRQTVDSLRKERGIDWQRPTRTKANNNIGLVRGSNRAMVLAVNAVMP